MKKYLVEYTVKRKGISPSHHNCIEFAESKKEVRDGFPHKIISIEELKDEIQVTKFYVVKDGHIEAIAPSKELAIDSIRVKQARETHPFIRADFSIIQGTQEFVPYLKKL